MITLTDLSQVYRESHALSDFNDLLDKDYYAIQYLKARRIKTVRVCVKRLEYIDVEFPALMYPMTFLNIHTGFIFKSLKNGGLYIFGSSGIPCYTSQETMKHCKDLELNTFVLSEGIIDAEVISEIYPYSLACNGALPSFKLAELLVMCTRSVIFIPDNDETGDDMAVKVVKRFSSVDRSFPLSVVRVGRGIKDYGDLARAENIKKRKYYLNDLRNKIRLNS